MKTIYTKFFTGPCECSGRSTGRRDFDILFFLICFIPYVSFFVIRGADVQPLFLLVGVVFFISGYCYRHWRLDQYEWRLLAAALLFLIYMNWFGNDNSWAIVIRKNASLLFGWLILICARRSRSMPTWVLVFLPGVYLVVALVQLVFPSLHNNMMVFIINEIRTQPARGVTGLCPEPSFLSMIGVCFLAILAVTKREEWQYYFFGMMLAVVSRSATGIGFLLIFMFFSMISQRRAFKKMIVLLPLVIFLTWTVYQIVKLPFYSYLSDQSVEISDLIQENSKGPSPSTSNNTVNGFSSKGSRWSVFSQGIRGVIYDPSCLPRLISFSSGLSSLPVYPFGTGEMFSSDTALIASRDTGLTDLWAKGMSEMNRSPYLERFMSKNKISDKNIASKMLIESLTAESGYINSLTAHFQRMGFVFVVLICLALSSPIFWRRENWPVLALVLIGWGFSTPLVYPPFWYLLGKILGLQEESCSTKF